MRQSSSYSPWPALACDRAWQLLEITDADMATAIDCSSAISKSLQLSLHFWLPNLRRTDYPGLQLYLVQHPERMSALQHLLVSPAVSAWLWDGVGAMSAAAEELLDGTGSAEKKAANTKSSSSKSGEANRHTRKDRNMTKSSSSSSSSSETAGSNGSRKVNNNNGNGSSSSANDTGSSSSNNSSSGSSSPLEVTGSLTWAPVVKGILARSGSSSVAAFLGEASCLTKCVLLLSRHLWFLRQREVLAPGQGNTQPLEFGGAEGEQEGRERVHEGGGGGSSTTSSSRIGCCDDSSSKESTLKSSSSSSSGGKEAGVEQGETRGGSRGSCPVRWPKGQKGDFSGWLDFMLPPYAYPRTAYEIVAVSDAPGAADTGEPADGVGAAAVGIPSAASKAAAAAAACGIEAAAGTDGGKQTARAGDIEAAAAGGAPDVEFIPSNCVTGFCTVAKLFVMVKVPKQQLPQVAISKLVTVVRHLQVVHRSHLSVKAKGEEVSQLLLLLATLLRSSSMELREEFWSGHGRELLVVLLRWLQQHQRELEIEERISGSCSDSSMGDDSRGSPGSSSIKQQRQRQAPDTAVQQDQSARFCEYGASSSRCSAEKSDLGRISGIATSSSRSSGKGISSSSSSSSTSEHGGKKESYRGLLMNTWGWVPGDLQEGQGDLDPVYMDDKQQAAEGKEAPVPLVPSFPGIVAMVLSCLLLEPCPVAQKAAEDVAQGRHADSAKPVVEQGGHGRGNEGHWDGGEGLGGSRVEPRRDKVGGGNKGQGVARSGVAGKKAKQQQQQEEVKSGKQSSFVLPGRNTATFGMSGEWQGEPGLGTGPWEGYLICCSYQAPNYLSVLHL